jgi:hypothetical protein
MTEMRRPRPVGSAIDARRLRAWINEFGSYRHAVTRISIEGWLDQFDNHDRDLGARILDSVDYYDNARVAAVLRTALQSIGGWHADPRRRTGRWRFASFSGSAGKSGDALLYHFRLANNLDGRQADEMFIYRSEILQQKLTSEDTLVFVDDLTATGSQVCEVWDEHFAELVAGIGRVFLVVILSGKGARQEIRLKTNLALVPGHELRDRDSLFSDECNFFSKAEKDKLLEYSRKAKLKRPKGFGDCGYLIVFQHRCPNNTVALLHECNSRWTGLFPRHD